MTFQESGKSGTEKRAYYKSREQVVYNPEEEAKRVITELETLLGFEIKNRELAEYFLIIVFKVTPKSAENIDKARKIAGIGDGFINVILRMITFKEMPVGNLGYLTRIMDVLKSDENLREEFHLCGLNIPAPLSGFKNIFGEKGKYEASMMEYLIAIVYICCDEVGTDGESPQSTKHVEIAIRKLIYKNAEYARLLLKNKITQ